MTDDRIRELAAKYAAYADSTLTLRGDAVVAFARELMARRDDYWTTQMLDAHLQMSDRIEKLFNKHV